MFPFRHFPFPLFGIPSHFIDLFVSLLITSNIHPFCYLTVICSVSTIIFQGPFSERWRESVFQWGGLHEWGWAHQVWAWVGGGA